MTKAELLAEIERLAKEAKSPHWSIAETGNNHLYIQDADNRHAMSIARISARIDRDANAHLICLLHNNLPAILSDLRDVEAAREALKPFADACAKADAHKAEVERAGMGTVSDSATPGWGIRYGHLKAARKALAALSEVTP